MGAVPARAMLETTGSGSYGAHLTFWRQWIFRETTHGGSATFHCLCLMSVLDEKTVLRRHFRTRRNQFVDMLAERERSLVFSALPSPLATLCKAGKAIAGYVPVGSEADPTGLLLAAERLGCDIVLPHVVSRIAPMRFLRWRLGDPLYEGPFGLQQPSDNAAEATPDIVIVPLLAFDDGLMRLGQGAGHYDRALSLLTDAIAIGLAWSVQHADTLPADPWDIPMDAVLTEKSWITL